MINVAHKVITLSGSAEQLPVASWGGRVRWISLQPGAANGNPIYIGSGSTVASTDYGVRLPAATGGEPPAPYIIGEFEDGSLLAEDIWVLGTSTQKLHVLVAVYHTAPISSTSTW